MGVTEAPTAAVVICAYTEARWDLTGKAVESVERQSHPPDEVVLVVDHNDTLLRRARAAWPAHTVIANELEKGLSGARNTGVGATSAAVVAFLDDDATADPRWLEQLLSHFTDLGVGGAGGLVRPAWSDRQPWWLPDEFLWVVGCSYRGLPESVARIRNPIGANMAFRRDLILATGGFTAGVGRVGALPVGCEETELSIRVRRLGFEIVYDPTAVVDHVVPAERADFSYFIRRCFNEGRSKAAVSKLVGASDALESERHYVRRTLPSGALRSLSRGALGRAAAIPAGLVATTLGYAWSQVRLQPMPPARGERPPTGADDADTPAALHPATANGVAAATTSRVATLDFNAIDDPVPEAWSGSLVRAIDVAAIACSTVLAAFVLSGRGSTLRQILALVFFLVVPGWALLRAVRARPCSLTLMGAVCLSIALAVIGGEVMVTELGFPWKGATILACGLCSLVLLVDAGAERWR